MWTQNPKPWTLNQVWLCETEAPNLKPCPKQKPKLIPEPWTRCEHAGRSHKHARNPKPDTQPYAALDKTKNPKLNLTLSPKPETLPYATLD